MFEFDGTLKWTCSSPGCAFRATWLAIQEARPDSLWDGPPCGSARRPVKDAAMRLASCAWRCAAAGEPDLGGTGFRP